MRRAVPLLVAVMLLAGCSETTDGSATPGGGATAASPSRGASSAAEESTKEGSTKEEPAKRPGTIDVEGVDPCALLTDAERARFGFDRPPQKGATRDLGWPTCTVSREDRAHFLGITLVTTEGIEIYRGTAPAFQVGGFPAVVIDAPGQAASCAVAIDVSDGQRVEVAVTSPGATTPQATLCQSSQQVAGAVVAALVDK